MIICKNVVQSPPKCQRYKKTNNSFHKETYNHPFHAQINSLLRQKRHKISNVLPPLIHFSCCKQTILNGPIGS